MADRAKISNIDAIDAFRGRLVIFMENARRALDEVDSEIRRTKTWLDNDAISNWQREVKLRSRKLEAAEQELLSARFSTLRESENIQQMAVRKARVAVREAEEKIRFVKRWSRDFDSLVSPLARHLSQLRHHLATQLPKGTAELAEIMKALDAYSDLARTAPTPPPSQPTEEDNETESTP